MRLRIVDCGLRIATRAHAGARALDCGLRNCPNVERRTSNASLTRAGFTLLEILIAISVLVVITGIVYESLEAVTNATETAREQDTELRVRDFLLRNFSSSISTIYVDPGFLNGQCQLIGKKGTSGIDSLEFCSSAPVMGGASEPGLLKRVQYGEAEDASDAKQGSLAPDSGEGDFPMFEAKERLIREPMETMILASSGALERQLRSVMSSEDLIEAPDQITPVWTLPVSAVSFLYFDGQDWVEEWDSTSMMRMPWCIRIRVNFVPSPDEDSNSGSRTLTPEDEGGFQMYVPVPIATGVHTDAATWQQILYGTTAGQTVATTTGSSSSTTSTSSSTTSSSTDSTSGSTSTSGASQTGSSSKSAETSLE